MSLFLGIDIGTSTAKAILFDPMTAQTLAVATQEYPLLKPTPQQAEQNPTDWWQAVIKVVRRVTQLANRHDVVAIGLSGQMHGTVLLNNNGAPIRPAIIWADQRSQAECAELVKPYGAQSYAAITGTLPAPGFLAATLLWLSRHEADTLAQCQTVLLPKDYIAFCLTNELATEVSDAAGTGIFNIQQRTWATEIIESAGLPMKIFPRVVASTDITGYLTTQAATELGLPAAIPVVAGCADQPAQAIGNGLITAGQASITIGSGGQIFVPLANVMTTDPRLHVFNHAVPDTWYGLGAILSAGLALRWLRDLVGLQNEANAYKILSAEAAPLPPGAHGLIFLPYLSGERTPHMDPLARGAFIGLTAYHQRGHLARAVMEGVAMALRQTLELTLALGGQVERIIAAGGGADSPIWRQILADVIGLPLQQTQLAEQAGVGAALLAGIGTGYYPNFAAACGQVVRLGPLTMPNVSHRARYDELYSQFVALYPHLKQNFHELAGND